MYRLKQDYPDLQISLNGGIESLQQVDEVLQHVDGVMLGRAAYHNPYLLAELEGMLPYIERELAAGERLHRITRHMTGLFLGQPGARAWRRWLSENAYKDNAGVEVLVEALQQMPMAA